MSLWRNRDFKNEVTGRTHSFRECGGEFILHDEARSLSEMSDAGHEAVGESYVNDEDIEAARNFKETGSTSRITRL